MKVWLASLTRAATAGDIERGIGLMFWDADAVGSTIDTVEILPPRVVVDGGELHVSMEPFGLIDVPTLRLKIDLASPEMPADFRALVLGGRRIGVFAAPGWIQLGNPLRYVSVRRGFLGIWEPDAPVRLRAGEPAELVFAEIANHVASGLFLYSRDTLQALDDVYARSEALLTYLTPLGRVTYWLRDVLAVPVGALLEHLFEQVRSRIDALIPPNFTISAVVPWVEVGRWVWAVVDVPDWGDQLHASPTRWTMLENVLLLLEARAYQGDQRLNFADYLRECQSLRDFLRRCAEATLTHWGLGLLQTGIVTFTGSPSIPSASYVLYCGALTEALVDYDHAFTANVDYGIQQVEVGAYQLRTVRVSAGQDYVEEIYARRGLEWGATPPFTAGIVPVEEHYHFRGGVAQFTERVPQTFPLVRVKPGDDATLIFCRRLRMKHYRSGTVHLLSDDYTSTDDLGFERGYRYSYALSAAEQGSVQRYAAAVAYKVSSVGTLLRCPFPCLGGYDFPEGVVRVGNPWRRLVNTVEIALARAFGEPFLVLGKQLLLQGKRVGTVIGVQQDMLTETAIVRVLQHDVSHENVF